MHDAIVLPGAGVRPDGSVPPWIENRLARVLEIGGDTPVVLLSAGTVHKPPPLDVRGRPVFEAWAAADWLLRHGVPASRLFIEAASWDTIGNGYFLRTMHTDPRGWRRLLVVASAFQQPRLEGIFGWVFGLPPVDPPYELGYEVVPDVEVSAARVRKEAAALATLPPLFARIRTLPELHHWLFTEHLAYAAGAPPPAPLPPDLLESY
jgi:uncharacterized SAM-binding protein YcdF (DUF218 family)